MGRFDKQIKNYFEIPFNPADVETNKANITSTLVNIGALLLVIYLIPGIRERGLFSVQILMTLLLLFVFIAAAIGLRRGYINPVGTILLVLSWSFVQGLFLFFENGLRAPAFTAMLGFMIIYAGILHGRRGAALITTATLLTSLVVIILEQRGIYLTEAKIPDIYWAGFGQLLFFSATAFLVGRNHHNLQKTIRMYQEEVEERREAELEIRKLNKELTLAYDTTLEGWAKALELRDKETEGHSRRVTRLAWLLAKQLGFCPDDLVWIRHGALLHDIGKMGIPDEILNKKGPLTAEEREVINRHPLIAYNLLKDIRFLDQSIEIPFYHHERWDGNGYPKGLRGEDIPLSARIFAVVDVWDALNCDRPYRKAWQREDAIEYLKDNAGTQFDPQVVDVFLNEVINHPLGSLEDAVGAA